MSSGNGSVSAVRGRPAVPFTAEDVTNLAQLSAFVAQACESAGDVAAGLKTAAILGDLAKRIASVLPLNESMRLAPPPLRLEREPDGQ